MIDYLDYIINGSNEKEDCIFQQWIIDEKHPNKGRFNGKHTEKRTTTMK